MKLKIQTSDLVQGLQSVQSVIKSRSAIPILTSVLIRAEEGAVSFYGTDLDTGITCTVPAELHSDPGGIALPAAKLFSIVRDFALPEVSLEIDGKNVATITSGASRYRLNGLPAADFPAFPTIVKSRTFTIDQSVLKGMLKRSAYAASHEFGNYNLCGVMFRVSSHGFMTASTDRRRLAYSSVTMSSKKEQRGDATISNLAIEELSRSLQDEGNLEMSFGNNQAMFVLDGPGTVVINTKLVEGEFPKFELVIPSKFEIDVIVPREEFMLAVKRASAMTNEITNAVKFSFTRNNVTVTAVADEVGDAQEEVALDYKGQDFAICFVPKYIVEALEAVDTDSVLMRFVDKYTMAMITTGDDYATFVAPMRIE